MFGYDRVVKTDKFFPDFIFLNKFTINDLEHYFIEEGLEKDSFNCFEIHHTNGEIIRYFNPPTDFDEEKTEKFIEDFRFKVFEKFGRKAKNEHVMFFEGWYKLDYIGQLRFRLVISKESGTYMLMSPNRFYDMKAFPSSLSTVTCMEVFSFRSSNLIVDELNKLLTNTFIPEKMEYIVKQAKYKVEGISIELIDQHLMLNRLYLI